MWYYLSRARFLALSNHFEGFAPIKQKMWPRNLSPSSTQADIVDPREFEMPVLDDNSLHSLTYLLFDFLHFVMLIYGLYAEDKKSEEHWKQVEACDACLPIIFSFPVPSVRVSGTVHQRPAAPSTVEVNKDGLQFPVLQTLITFRDSCSPKPIICLYQAVLNCHWNMQITEKYRKLSRWIWTWKEANEFIWMQIRGSCRSNASRRSETTRRGIDKSGHPFLIIRQKMQWIH